MIQMKFMNSVVQYILKAWTRWKQSVIHKLERSGSCNELSSLNYNAKE